jgi:quercetin dioxygenase-like cupin family protein/catechol 2,3-dioxygenase-like lactoylglutathione lyase family enzyme
MTPAMEKVQAAEICLPSKDLATDLAFFTERLGFRLDTIFPADDPATATISGHGARIRLNREAAEAPSILQARDPPPAPAFVVHRLKDGGGWGVGRAGMQYRDLIPGRLGGALIASHIRIPDPGPVPDLVHFHDIAFQLIFCHRGWVRVVYEDQGPPFVLNAGDCLIQPPRIRHRVLEASENLEVIEVSAPARHLTTMDHDLTLPTPAANPDRDFGGQKFHRSEAARAVWTRGELPGLEVRETGILEATGGVARVRLLRPAGSEALASTRHTAKILFTFVRSGAVILREGGNAHALTAGDACVIPPGLETALADASGDLELLEVALI